VKSLPLGSFASRLLGNHPWNDGYPAYPTLVDELERLLLFAQDERRIDQLVARLRGKVAQRDEALNELRVGMHFKSVGYRIVEWEPLGDDLKRGEYSITHDGHDEIFVEVKSPGWEGELSSEEVRAGRTKQPKYQLNERRGGGFSQWPQIRACVNRAYPKFAPSSTNLLVIADDYFMPPDDIQIKPLLSCYKSNRISWLTESVELSWESDG